jgi:hypothetical protein
MEINQKESGFPVNTYEDRLSKAVLQWRGCEPPHRKAYYDQMIREIDAYVTYSDAEPHKQEIVLKNMWLAVFDRYFKVDCLGIELSLLQGILENDRWRPLFDKPDTAYHFSFLVFKYVQEMHLDCNHPMGSVVLRMLRSAMPEWIGPVTGDDENSLRPIAVALFGDPWCAVVYDALGHYESLGVLIATTRPPFLPGRINGSIEPIAAPLPELTC